MATLTGKIVDVTSRSPDSISSITVKAPSARIGSGTEVIVSSPAKVDFDPSTGNLTISDLTGGLSWLYIEGDGWSDSIALAVAEGMITLVEAIANAIGLPGLADYIRLLAELETRIDGIAQGAVDEAVDAAAEHRLLGHADSEDVAFAVVDDDNRRTWLEVAPDGKPTDYARSQMRETINTDDASFAVVDDNNRRTWLEVAKDGGPTDYARSLIGNTGGGNAVAVPDFPTSDWAHWGDSNTDSYHLGGESWTSKLAQLTGKNHYMGGYYSQKSINIAARQGGAPSLVTVAGNVTAASGATEITEAVNPVTAFSRAYDITGTLAGVHGQIKPLADEKQSFTPTVPGVYDIPPRSVFTPDAASMRDRHMTIWMGRNDRWDDGAPQQVTRSARHMVDFLSPRVKRFLILQLVPGTDGLDDPLVKSVNDMLQVEFPSQFVPIAEWMMTDRAADLAGITYTEQDLTDIAAGRIPTSFRSDNAHFNGVGCTAIAHFLHEEILKRGWL